MANSNVDYSEDDIVVLQQFAIAAYVNENNDVVIRQITDIPDDSFVFVTKKNLPELIEKLNSLIGVYDA